MQPLQMANSARSAQTAQSSASATLPTNPQTPPPSPRAQRHNATQLAQPRNASIQAQRADQTHPPSQTPTNSVNHSDGKTPRTQLISHPRVKALQSLIDLGDILPGEDGEQSGGAELPLQKQITAASNPHLQPTAAESTQNLTNTAMKNEKFTTPPTFAVPHLRKGALAQINPHDSNVHNESSNSTYSSAALPNRNNLPTRSLRSCNSISRQRAPPPPPTKTPLASRSQPRTSKPHPTKPIPTKANKFQHLPPS